MRKLFLLALLFGYISSSAQTLPTRFYLPSAGSPDVTPELSNIWTQTEGYVVRPLVTTKTGSPFTALTLSVPSVINTSTLFANYVSPPLAAQTINCTVVGQARWRVSNAPGIVIYTYVVINIIDPSGAIKATLLAPASGEVDFFASLTSMNTPISQTVGPYQCLDGDRLSIEYGTLRTDGTNIRTATMDMGDASGTDQLIGNTGSSAYNPWIEFSQTLQFYTGPAARPRRVTIVQ